MGKRRCTQVGSDDDAPPPRVSNDNTNSFDMINNNTKNINLSEENEEIEEELEKAKPVGEVIRVSGNGNEKRTHYNQFVFDGLHYHLEDSVLLTPDAVGEKPYVAIIKDIYVNDKGSMYVMGQWFYRPEEAQKHGGRNCQSSDPRELFYTFHRDEVSPEFVMHTCVVHFIPLNKQIPDRKEHPGFVVQKVYCTDSKRLFKLTDKDYEDGKQEEIDLLVQKTMSLLGELPDIQPDDGAGLLKRNMAPFDVSREEELVSKSAQSLKETPGSCPSDMSEYGAILYKFNVLTGDSQRDNRLEKLLQVIHAVCTSVDGQTDGKERNSNDVRSPNTTGSAQLAPEDKSKDAASFRWPDSAVPAVVSLENAAHELFSSDTKKYNAKMRQMTFNLKPNALLSRRFLNGELEPLQIVNMTPNELKEGLTPEEIESGQQPEEAQHLQMTDARCDRCSKKEVGLRDIIQAGKGDRYQLECTNCGNTWYASRDQAAILTIGASSGPTVRTAPSATAKFEDAEKALTIPR